MRTRLAAIAACAIAGAGCASEPNPVVCTAIAVSSLAVTVRDAATGQAVCDARVTATQDGTVHELQMLGAGPGCTYSGPYEVPGTFAVQAMGTVYDPSPVRSVQVGRDECHVIPVQLTLEVRRRAP